MEFDGIILDIDGTLWDTTDIVAEAWNKSIKKIAPKIPLVTGAILKKEFGKTMKVIADDLFIGISEKDKDILMKDCVREEHTAVELNKKDITYEGVRETIEVLSKKIPVFIVSNCHKGYIEQVEEKNNLTKFITDKECYGNNGKNKDENIRLVVERNRLNNPVYVGDTAGDADACIKAGVKFIWASYGFGKVEEGKFWKKIESFGELVNLI